MAYFFARRAQLAATLSCCRYASSESPFSAAVQSVSKSAIGSPSRNSFAAMGIGSDLCDGLKAKFSITQPNAVQLKAIPHLMEGRDLMIQSETGSGKTLSFLLPIIQKSKHVCSTLIIVPTRELAVQTLHIANALKPPSSQGPYAVALVSGVDGTLAGEDIQKLSPRVIIATPKRLLEVMSETPQLFFTVRHVVLDEVDRLIPTAAPSSARKSRFHPKPTIVALTVLREELLKGRSSSLQLVGVSATLSHTMRAELLDLGFSEKARLVYMQDRIGIPPSILHRVALYSGAHQDKAILLTQIFNSLGAQQALVFVHDGAPIDNFVHALKRHGMLAEALHDHQARPDSLEGYEAFLEDFRRGDIQMVVANESTVRGLDFPFVKHVILLEVPATPASYVHLAGRASRTGEEGIITTVACTEDSAFPNLDRIFRKLNIKPLKVAPQLLDITSGDDEDSWDRAGAVILEMKDGRVTQEIAASVEAKEDEGSRKRGSKQRSVLDEDDEDAFDLNSLDSDDEVKRLLHSKHAVPVFSDDMPYDTAMLGRTEMRPDDRG